MRNFATIVIATIALAQPALAVAGDTATDSHAKPASFVPHAPTNQHVYGAPIEPAIMGHGAASHHKKTPKKRPPSPQKPG
jgi:hypothetical protein